MTFIIFFLLPAVSSPQTENTRSMYASDAGADNKSLQEEPKGDHLIHNPKV